MKKAIHPNPSKIRPSHLTYSAFCSAAKHQTTWLFALIANVKNANSFCPAKQRRALLESTPPRDSWIERRRNKTVSVFGEAPKPPQSIMGRHLFQSLSMPYKTHPKHKLLNRKTTLTGTRFFEASAVTK